MEPLKKEKDKRMNSHLIPYIRRGGEFLFYLQKRSVNAKWSANKVGLFGGGREEGETMEQTLMREIKEELEYIPTKPIYFTRYEFANFISHVFIEEVTEKFERSVVVHEGQYGKFYTLKEVETLPDIHLPARVVVLQVVAALTE